ncbi:MAG: segregation/condensation protein A [Candidatus Micrarchaeaceae archaeon]
MATQELEILGIEKESNTLDLSRLVNDATWKDILIDLVRNNEIDPWNIDIVDIVDKYVGAIKKLKVMDLRVPANIILAAAILLRLKSEMLNLFDRQEFEDTPEDNVFIREPVTIEELSLRLRPPIKRKIALVELIHALEEAMKIKEKQSSARLLKGVQFDLKFEEEDMEKEIEKLNEQIKNNVDNQNMTTFSYLSKELQVKNDNIVTKLFIPLLFLAHKEKVYLVQEEFFGEIIIKLAEG